MEHLRVDLHFNFIVITCLTTGNTQCYAEKVGFLICFVLGFFCTSIWLKCATFQFP